MSKPLLSLLGAGILLFFLLRNPTKLKEGELASRSKGKKLTSGKLNREVRQEALPACLASDHGYHGQLFNEIAELNSCFPYVCAGD